jgi:hypothetical protein
MAYDSLDKRLQIKKPDAERGDKVEDRDCGTKRDE